MLRINNKAKKIAYRILGIPYNLQKIEKRPRKRKIEEQLIAQDTKLAR